MKWHNAALHMYWLQEILFDKLYILCLAICQVKNW